MFVMASRRTCLLLAAATLFSGVLAGGLFDRAMVAAPAWRALGAAAWAQFSRRADLGFGIVAYPVEGVGAALFALAAAVSFNFDRSPARTALLPLYLAAAFALAGLAFTVKAAPIMLGIGDAPSGLRTAYDEFAFWGVQLRGWADCLAFGAEIWAFSILARKP